jgi:hypothetical protein
MAVIYAHALHGAKADGAQVFLLLAHPGNVTFRQAIPALYQPRSLRRVSTVLLSALGLRQIDAYLAPRVPTCLAS